MDDTRLAQTRHAVASKNNINVDISNSRHLLLLATHSVNWLPRSSRLHQWMIPEIDGSKLKHNNACQERVTCNYTQGFSVKLSENSSSFTTFWAASAVPRCALEVCSISPICTRTSAYVSLVILAQYRTCAASWIWDVTSAQTGYSRQLINLNDKIAAWIEFTKSCISTSNRFLTRTQKCNTPQEVYLLFSLLQSISRSWWRPTDCFVLFATILRWKFT